MARVTQAQAIQNENESYALEYFRSILSPIKDPRRKQGKRYPFVTVVVVALMATICGADDAQAMEDWGAFHEDWLSRVLEMPHGAPTQDVFLSVLGSLKPESFETLLISWARLLTTRLAGQQIAIDGKTSRGSFDPANDKAAVHTLSAWAVDSGISIGQCTVDGKTNEITAIPELLKLLDIRGSTVTVDAIGCQTTVAASIKNAGAEYLLCVKENQPKLHHDIDTAFKFIDRSQDSPVPDLPAPVVQRAHTIEKAHGRIENRTVEICRDLSWLSNPERWEDLNYFARITRTREIRSSGKVSTETVFYIGSNASANAKLVLLQSRRHWAIENECHWVLDRAFNEDDARHRANYAAQNMATIRKFALNIFKTDKTMKRGKRGGLKPLQLGVANRRKLAGWNKNYLIDLLIQSRG